MVFIWDVHGGPTEGKYIQLFRGGSFYPLGKELAEEMLARSTFRDVAPPEIVPEFDHALEVKVKEAAGDGPELIMNPSPDGGFRYSLRLFEGGESFFISPHFAYGLKHTNRLELVIVGQNPTKKERGRATVYRLSPLQPSCMEDGSERICSYRA